MYDIILKNKKYINIEKILMHLIQTCDIKNIVFMFEYMDLNLAKYIFTNGDTIAHILCKLIIQNDDKYEYNIEKQLKFLKILLYYFPESLNLQNNNGDTLIFCACSNSYVCEYLLSIQHDNININYIGDTYIHNIVRYGTYDVLSRIFMYEKINIINYVNNEHETPILLACKLKKTDMINLLLKNGSDNTITDNDGNSIYHYISLYSLHDVEIVEFPEIKNKYNFTPSDYVLQNIFNKMNIIKNEN
jgi:ankyrin repeat protein